jgi:hypothetical protein
MTPFHNFDPTVAPDQPSLSENKRKKQSATVSASAV